MSNLPTSAQILVVEDESEIRELISLLLLRMGHRVQQCSQGQEVLQKIQQNNFDLLILDWMLPGLSGVEILQALRQSPGFSTPVLMITAKSSPEDIVFGLENGADDYMTKPFENSVFQARVRALLRRRQDPPQAHGVFQFGELRFNVQTYEVSCCGEPLHLTPSEFKILVTMAENRGKVMTRDQLIQVVQGEGISVTGRTIDTHVFGLRKKLQSCADWIETIRGVGYRVRA